LPPDTIEPDFGPRLPDGWTRHTVAEVATGRLRTVSRSSDQAVNLFWSPPADSTSGIMAGCGLCEIMDAMRGLRSVMAGREAIADYPLMPDPKHGFFVCTLAPGNYTVRDARYLDWHAPEPATPGVPTLEPEAARRAAYFATFGPRHKPDPVAEAEAAKADEKRRRLQKFKASYRAARPGVTDAEVAGAVYEFVRGALPSAFRPRLARPSATRPKLNKRISNGQTQGVLCAHRGNSTAAR
jgi:hypothetical protein